MNPTGRVKENYIKLHLSKRCSQRLGIELTEFMRKMLIRKIYTNKAELVEKISNKRSKYIMNMPKLFCLMNSELKDKKLLVIYDKKYHQIVTCYLENESTE